jgi:hypothetical protein
MSNTKWLFFLSLAVPVHEEFFNRIIDAYPRSEDGLLAPIVQAGNVTPAVEFLMLRNIAVRSLLLIL